MFDTFVHESVDSYANPNTLHTQFLRNATILTNQWNELKLFGKVDDAPEPFIYEITETLTNTVVSDEELLRALIERQNVVMDAFHKILLLHDYNQDTF
jgi:hypothetical protein